VQLDAAQATASAFSVTQIPDLAIRPRGETSAEKGGMWLDSSGQPTSTDHQAQNIESGESDVCYSGESEIDDSEREGIG